jgi:hypothetical protein
MKAGIQKRLTWLELVLVADTDEPPLAVDRSVFSDAELERLEWFAEQYAGWTSDGWVEAGLNTAERIELDTLMAKVTPVPE